MYCLSLNVSTYRLRKSKTSCCVKYDSSRSGTGKSGYPITSFGRFVLKNHLTKTFNLETAHLLQPLVHRWVHWKSILVDPDFVRINPCSTYFTGLFVSRTIDLVTTALTDSSNTSRTSSDYCNFHFCQNKSHHPATRILFYTFLLQIKTKFYI